MIRRTEAPTEEQLADAEAEVERRKSEREFEENRQRQNAKRPPGAAKMARTRAFRVTEPPLNRGAGVLDDDGFEPPPPDESPADQLRQLRVAEPIETTAKPVGKKKGKYDVPDAKTASTVIEKLGVVYVEDEKEHGAVVAFKNLRTSIMLNLSVLMPMMPQIKQMFELLQIGEPERGKANTNGKGDIGKLTSGIRSWLQGDDE